MAEPSDTSLRGAGPSARQLGRRQAEAFDLRLQQVESREREQRLTEAAWRPAAERGAGIDEDAVAQLEARVSELTTYVRAIESSRPWRLIQGLRRLFGRKW